VHEQETTVTNKTVFRDLSLIIRIQCG